MKMVVVVVVIIIMKGRLLAVPQGRRCRLMMSPHDVTVTVMSQCLLKFMELHFEFLYKYCIHARTHTLRNHTSRRAVQSAAVQVCIHMSPNVYTLQCTLRVNTLKSVRVYTQGPEREREKCWEWKRVVYTTPRRGVKVAVLTVEHIANWNRHKNNKQLSHLSR